VGGAVVLRIALSNGECAADEPEVLNPAPHAPFSLP